MSNQTVSGICLGTFTDSNAGDLVTGGAGNYGNNENFIMTFCSNNAQLITVIFSYLNIGAGDHFRIYDGPDTLSPLITDISSYNPVNYYVSSSGNCLTFWFTSDGSGAMFSPNGNWAAFFQCGNYDASNAASDACADAPSICDFSNYFGNTSNYYTPDYPGNMCTACSLFDGSIENNSWVTFVANNDTASFTVNLLSCTNNQGIQFGVYQGINCSNFSLMTPLSWTAPGTCPIPPGSSYTITATGLLSGQMYYIMIDGFAGDNCQYIIQAQSGMQFGGTITPDQSICAGDTATIQATLSGNASFTWTSSPTDPSLAGQEHNANISVSPTTTTTYMLTSQDASICSNDTLYSTVTVFPAPVATITADPVVTNVDAAISFTGSTGNGINQWTWNFNYPDGIFETTTTNTTTHSYSNAGTYTVYLLVKNNGGCVDSTTIQVNVVEFEIPNIFTPNGDGVNDFFKIKGIDKLPNTNIKIFNRWGKKIFDADNYRNTWNGEDYADGVYYYILTLDDGTSYSGTITLIR